MRRQNHLARSLGPDPADRPATLASFLPLLAGLAIVLGGCRAPEKPVAVDTSTVRIVDQRHALTILRKFWTKDNRPASRDSIGINAQVTDTMFIHGHVGPSAGDLGRRTYLHGITNGQRCTLPFDHINAVETTSNDGGRYITITMKDKCGPSASADSWGIAGGPYEFFWLLLSKEESTQFLAALDYARGINTAPEPAPTTRARNNFCQKCGKALHADNAYCEHCGDQQR